MTFQIYFSILTVIVFWCVGFYRVTRKGMILGFMSDWAEKTREIKNNPNLEGVEYIIPSWISNPIVSCIFCIASVHGFLVYATYFMFSDLQWTWGNTLVVVPLCVSASALNGLVYGILKNLLPEHHHD